MKKKALFIDRDGTIVIEDQIDSFERIIWIPYVFQSFSRIRRESEFELVMVSNQDGVGTPSFPYEDFLPVHERIMSTLEGEGIWFDDVNIDYSLPSDNCPTRKPGVKMLESYMDGSYDLSSSFVIGDRLTDMTLAKNLGSKGIWLSSKDSVVPPEFESTIALVSDDWREIEAYLLPGTLEVPRKATVERNTKETQAALSVCLDGTGKGNLGIGNGFFDHMAEQIVKHSRFDITCSFHGDLEVDEHHSVEDLALALGEAVLRALGDKRGIERYGFEVLTMDDVVATVSLDFSGRPELIWDVPFKRTEIGTFPTEMFKHFFKSFSDSAKMNLYVSVTYGNEHHMAEACFKAFGRALRKAVRRIPGSTDLPSTKGML